ncbi:MAG: RDD family protein [Nocardioides sp.]
MSDPTSRAPEFATLTDDDLVTGEAVALDLPAAGLGARMVSGLIDVAVTVVLLLLVVLVFFVAALRTDGALVRVAWIGSLVTVFVVFPTTVETVTRGKSLGKLVTGLRTVRDDAGPISFQHAFVRSLVGFVEIYALSGAPAFFAGLLSSRGKRLGDYAAGTYVVRERVGLRLPPPTAMPPALAEWAAGADIASLPTGLAVALRQFLGRAAQIEPSSRDTLGRQLAEETRPYVAPPPPPGTPPEAFLAAVVAVRRDRDHARLQREAALRQRLTARR